MTLPISRPCPRRSRPARDGARDPAALAGRQGLRPFPGPDGRRPDLDLLRRAAHRQRHARRPSHRGPGLQGRLPPVQDHAGIPCAAPGRLGLPWPAGRGGGRERTRPVGQEGHRGVRHRRVQPALPRVGAAACGRVRGTHRPARLLDRPVQRVPHDGCHLHRVRLVVAQGDLPQGPAGQGLPDQPVLPALRDGPVGPRDGPAGRLPRGDRPRRDGAVPAADRARRGHAAAGRGGPAGVDHHAVDPSVQHRRGRAPRRKLRRGPPGGRPGCRRGGGAADAAGPRRRLACRGQPARFRPGRGDVPAAVQPRGHPRRAPSCFPGRS